MSRQLQESIDKRNAAVMLLEANYRKAIERISKLERALAERNEDAEKWHEHRKLQGAARIPGALYMRMTMVVDDVPWCVEHILSTHDLVNGLLGVRQIGLAAEDKYRQLLAAIDSARKAGT